jgi:hypothetical protein
LTETELFRKQQKPCWKPWPAKWTDLGLHVQKAEKGTSLPKDISIHFLLMMLSLPNGSGASVSCIAVAQ